MNYIGTSASFGLEGSPFGYGGFWVGQQWRIEYCFVHSG